MQTLEKRVASEKKESIRKLRGKDIEVMKSRPPFFAQPVTLTPSNPLLRSCWVGRR